MFKLLTKYLDTNEKELSRYKTIVEKINSLESETKKLKDEDFPARTAAFKDRIEKGETLENILPEAFALAREASVRGLGLRPFDVQLMAAIALFEGKIAEQKTGEGKTLTAALALYLRALTGKGTHLVTVNDYLARLGTGWNGRIFNLFGLKVGCIIHEQAFLFDPEYEDKSAQDWRLSHLKEVNRQQAYLADITYGTNNEFGFDYLRDNMVNRLEDMVQRGHYYAIIDEVDSILIDEARTPLIISAPDTEPTQKYYEFAKLIDRLSSDTDYVIDEKVKTANLTEHGVKKVEKILGVDNLYEKDFESIHHIENALRARTLFLRDKDYVVKEGEVIIVDEFTGRLMYGRRWSEGLHQAVEAKENVKIQQESRTLATISFQNYFRMYEKLAGMTGTAATESEEFHKIYNLEVIVVPTNKQMIRIDNADVVYKTGRAKYAAIAREVEECYKKGQPVLVGTTSIEKNEIVSDFLTHKKISHQVLNAKQHEKEAEIIAQAGKKGTVTVATNMAGRGVDIILGGKRMEKWEVGSEKEWKDFEEKWQKEHDEVVGLGGLHVIGTERHESRRIDNQLRGRSGRQGDPGSSRFFVALDDDLMRIFGGDQVSKMMTLFKLPEDQPLEHGMVSKAIEQSQVKVEGFNFDQRKHLVEYDDIANKQREVIYRLRRKVLEGQNWKEEILTIIKGEIDNLIRMYFPEGISEPEKEKIIHGFCEIVPFDDQSQLRLADQIGQVKDPEKISEFLLKIVTDLYDSREKQLGPELSREIEKFAYLSSIDKLWMDHLDAMDDLRDGVGLRGNNDQERIAIYKKDAFEMFETLVQQIDYEVVRKIFRIQVGAAPPPMPMPQNISTNLDSSDSTGLKQKPVVVEKKLGRNDPCWCGSGKKFKHCHYPQLG
ncbi:preprotein translocase subunit SecA [Candidatus Shapirobacteria bacterium CG08_land_8_20_14_0_20_39_18]|uniref:Protein translocase subunit SecA n=1 Tax=Candidatus Shapirobacteria bacterium CG08_land_8_20_14_0_20_39_18 TaxID=1974883 RepID=A0A2M6XDP6_9BACT|nr:MAG: preprotein translocase subunit SecA [Candidatus Shapirobacteria bacterium CG08_land_8_20_14_0_20_39_18]PJE68287.1 MAG: preprotein translocase subunit SecA [Candidatus Shapirobacteria bacterium CG10_big_fil_rev_8_21_14_0_10_38_8]